MEAHFSYDIVGGNLTAEKPTQPKMSSFVTKMQATYQQPEI